MPCPCSDSTVLRNKKKKDYSPPEGPPSYPPPPLPMENGLDEDLLIDVSVPDYGQQLDVQQQLQSSRSSANSAKPFIPPKPVITGQTSLATDRHSHEDADSLSAAINEALKWGQPLPDTKITSEPISKTSSSPASQSPAKSPKRKVIGSVTEGSLAAAAAAMAAARKGQVANDDDYDR